MNEKKAKAIRKQVGFHPADPRGYKGGNNSKKAGSTGTLAATGSRAVYKQAKKLAEGMENDRRTA